MVRKIMVLGGASEIANEVLNQLNSMEGISSLILIGRPGPSLEGANRHWATRLGSACVHVLAVDFASPSQAVPDIWELVQREEPDTLMLAAAIQPDEGEAAQIVGQVASVSSVNYTTQIAVAEAWLARSRNPVDCRLIVLSSVAAIRPRASNYVYGSSKAALDFWARGAMDRYAKTSSIFVMRLGRVETRLARSQPSAPFALSASEAGERIAVTLKGKPGVHWIPGKIWLVMFVARLLPRRLWVTVAKWQAGQRQN